MSSTENLLQESNDATNTLESGYHSDDTAEGEQSVSSKQRRLLVRKRRLQRNVGLENKGFETDDGQSNRGDTSRGKHDVQIHRTLSETTPRQVSELAERGGGRRHSYAGRSSTELNEDKSVPLRQRKGKQRRSSSTEEDLRRRACLNSMRLRRASSTIRTPVSEYFDDKEVFYDYVQLTMEGKDHTTGYQENSRSGSMRSLTSAVEMENSYLREYSRRLSLALKERAMLQENLTFLRRSSSLFNLNADEDGKLTPIKTHFRNETFNSVRQTNSTSGDYRPKSLKELKHVQTAQSRKLPDLPMFIARPAANEFRAEEETRRDKDTTEQLQLEKQTERAPMEPERKVAQDRNTDFNLSNLEKERRERKISELASDLWKKLLQGEKFHTGDGSTLTTEPECSTMEGVSNPQGGKNTDRGKKDVLRREPHLEDNIYSMSSISRDVENQNDVETAIGVCSKTSSPQFGKIPKSEVEIPSPIGSESNFVRSEAFRREPRKASRHKRASRSMESLLRENPISDSQVSKVPQELVKESAGHSREPASHTHSGWFDYMFPPGARRDKNMKAPQKMIEAKAQREQTLPSPLTDKLRYYQQLQGQRSEVETVFDLADAYMAVDDAEAKRALQKRAAGEAAILRREASHLLWRAMNLERICDPNARVRHIFTPY